MIILGNVIMRSIPIHSRDFDPWWGDTEDWKHTTDYNISDHGNAADGADPSKGPSS